MRDIPFSINDMNRYKPVISLTTTTFIRQYSLRAAAAQLDRLYSLKIKTTVLRLTFWRRIFFQILAHPVFKM